MRVAFRVLLGGVLLVSAGSARAQERSLLSHEHKDYASPQYFAIELRFAPYRPQIDNEPALQQGKKPYDATFGSTRRLEVAAEFDWQALRIPHVGSLGPGIGLGYTSMNAKARISQTLANPNPGLSGEDTSLDIFPMYLVAVFRADVFSRDFGIPLVPYVKGGVGYALWRASNSLGTSNAYNVEGTGHTWGTNFALGLGLDLNLLDAYSARALDNATGINHTYIYGELMVAALNGLGQASALHVGTSTWAAGLAFEF